jgi:hypothetical protein
VHSTSSDQFYADPSTLAVNQFTVVTTPASTQSISYPTGYISGGGSTSTGGSGLAIAILVPIIVIVVFYGLCYLGAAGLIIYMCHRGRRQTAAWYQLGGPLYKGNVSAGTAAPASNIMMPAPGVVSAQPMYYTAPQPPPGGAPPQYGQTTGMVAPYYSPPADRAMSPPMGSANTTPIAYQTQPPSFLEPSFPKQPVEAPASTPHPMGAHEMQ